MNLKVSLMNSISEPKLIIFILGDLHNAITYNTKTGYIVRKVYQNLEDTNLYVKFAYKWVLMIKGDWTTDVFCM